MLLALHDSLLSNYELLGLEMMQQILMHNLVGFLYVCVCMDSKSVSIAKLSLAEVINDVLVIILFTSHVSKSLSAAVHGSIWRSGIECII